ALDVAVAVAPGAELLDDPRRQAGGRVVEPVAERLRLRALDALVARLLLEELPRAHQVDDLLLREPVGGVRGVGREGDHHVQVDAGARVRVVRAEVRAHHRAPVAALRAEAGVAEAGHQLGPEGGDPLRVHAERGRAVGEPGAPHRRADDVERVGRVAAVRRRIGERADHLHELGDRAGPAVRHDERERLGPPAAHVEEVDAEAADMRAELRDRVERRLRAPPVVALAPVRDELAEVREVGPLGPAGAGDLVGEARAREPLAEVGEDGVGDGDPEGFDPHGALLRRPVPARQRAGSRGQANGASPSAPAGSRSRSPVSATSTRIVARSSPTTTASTWNTAAMPHASRTARTSHTPSDPTPELSTNLTPKPVDRHRAGVKCAKRLFSIGCMPSPANVKTAAATRSVAPCVRLMTRSAGTDARWNAKY